jgi:hypothetical protein
MPAAGEPAESPIAVRQAAAILLLSAITCGPAAAQVFDRDPDAAGPRLSSSREFIRSHESRFPANLIVPDVVRPVVKSMWQRSPTFRRQCARLAGRPDVTVRIELAIGVRDGWARSYVRRSDQGLSPAVQIELRRPALYVEYVAHELEHVLEQVDGTDVARLAAQGLDGVVDLGRHYETARARWVGRTVAREVMSE